MAPDYLFFQTLKKVQYKYNTIHLLSVALELTLQDAPNSYLPHDRSIFSFHYTKSRGSAIYLRLEQFVTLPPSLYLNLHPRALDIETYIIRNIALIEAVLVVLVSDVVEAELAKLARVPTAAANGTAALAAPAPLLDIPLPTVSTIN